jgi:phosphatidate cytidylyltransferase
VRDFKKRAFVALCAGPLIIILFYFLPPKWLFFFLSVVALSAVLEVAAMARTRAPYRVPVLTMLCLVPLYQKSYHAFTLYLLFTPVLYLVIAFLRGETKQEDINREILRGTSTILLCGFFVLLPLFYFYLLKERGAGLPLVLLLTLWASDTCAYLFGKGFGKRKLIERVSPGKTYEGLLGAILGSMIVITLCYRATGLGIIESILLGGVIGMLGQAGDILESVGKRVCGVKDSSTLIPGHGGVLDRMDSFIFTAPFLYHYMAGMRG